MELRKIAVHDSGKLYELQLREIYPALKMLHLCAYIDVLGNDVGQYLGKIIFTHAHQAKIALQVEFIERHKINKCKKNSKAKVRGFNHV